MLAKTARYAVRPEARSHCEATTREFLATLGEEPGTRVYLALRERAETTRFLHVMVFDDEVANERHRQAAHTRRFIEALYPHTLDGVALHEFEPINPMRGVI